MTFWLAFVAIVLFVVSFRMADAIIPFVTSSPPPDPNSWQSFLDHTHPEAHLLQTARWGQLKSEFGWSTEYVRAGDAGAQVLLRQLPLGLTLAYVPKGPVGDWLEALLPALDELCDRHNAFALKVEPDSEWNPDTAERLRTADFRRSSHSVQPLRSLVMDITPDEDDILAEMHSKTRYNIRLSGRKDVEVRPWDDVEAFGRMIGRTADRQDFGAHVPEYYRRAYDLFHPHGECELFVAEYEGEPLAALMVFARADRAWYLYGASTPKERNRMPTYALQWAAIRWAKDRGCSEYDLWGVPDASEEELEEQFTERSDGLWGVYRFKRGFGGELRRFLGAWDRVYRPAVYTLYRLLARRWSS